MWTKLAPTTVLVRSQISTALPHRLRNLIFDAVQNRLKTRLLIYVDQVRATKWSSRNNRHLRLEASCCCSNNEHLRCGRRCGRCGRRGREQKFAHGRAADPLQPRPRSVPALATTQPDPTPSQAIFAPNRPTSVSHATAPRRHEAAAREARLVFYLLWPFARDPLLGLLLVVAIWTRPLPRISTCCCYLSASK